MRILIVNAHWNNRGDEAALCALIDSLLNMYKAIRQSAEIHIIFKETKIITEWPYDGIIQYDITRFRPSEEEFTQIINNEKSDNTHIQLELNLVTSSDVVIYSPGGAVISDRFWWEKQLEYILPIAYAQKIGKKTLFAAPSVGPFNTEHKLRNDLFISLDALCLRESIGFDAVMRLVGKKFNQILSCDLAFLGKVNIEKASKILKQDKELKFFLQKYNRIVGITASDLLWNVGYLGPNNLKNKIEESINGLITWFSEQNIGVILIPQLFGEQSDHNYLKHYLFSNCFLLSSKFDSNFQQYIISKLYALVGIRYHSNIFAAKMGTPMIPIVYEQKMEGFLKDAEIQNWSVNVADISVEALISKFKIMESEYSDRKAFLENKLAEWTNKANLTINEIKRIIRTGADA